jgi:hypothetical protein
MDGQLQRAGHRGADAGTAMTDDELDTRLAGLERRLLLIEARLERTMTSGEFYKGLLLAGTMTGIMAVLLALFEFGT